MDNPFDERLPFGMPTPQHIPVPSPVIGHSNRGSEDVQEDYQYYGNGSSLRPGYVASPHHSQYSGHTLLEPRNENRQVPYVDTQYSSTDPDNIASTSKNQGGFVGGFLKGVAGRLTAGRLPRLFGGRKHQRATTTGQLDLDLAQDYDNAPPRTSFESAYSSAWTPRDSLYQSAPGHQRSYSYPDEKLHRRDWSGDTADQPNSRQQSSVISDSAYATAQDHYDNEYGQAPRLSEPDGGYGDDYDYEDGLTRSRSRYTSNATVPTEFSGPRTISQRSRAPRYRQNTAYASGRDAYNSSGPSTTHRRNVSQRTAATLSGSTTYDPDGDDYDDLLSPTVVQHEYGVRPPRQGDRAFDKYALYRENRGRIGAVPMPERINIVRPSEEPGMRRETEERPLPLPVPEVVGRTGSQRSHASRRRNASLDGGRQTEPIFPADRATQIPMPEPGLDPYSRRTYPARGVSPRTYHAAYSDTSLPDGRLFAVSQVLNEVSRMPWVDPDRVTQDFLPDQSSSRSKYRLAANYARVQEEMERKGKRSSQRERDAEAARRATEALALEGVSWYRPKTSGGYNSIMANANNLFGKHKMYPTDADPYLYPYPYVSQNTGGLFYTPEQGYFAPVQQGIPANQFQQPIPVPRSPDGSASSSTLLTNLSSTTSSDHEQGSVVHSRTSRGSRRSDGNRSSGTRGTYDSADGDYTVERAHSAQPVYMVTQEQLSQHQHQQSRPPSIRVTPAEPADLGEAERDQHYPLDRDNTTRTRRHRSQRNGNQHERNHSTRSRHHAEQQRTPPPPFPSVSAQQQPVYMMPVYLTNTNGQSRNDNGQSPPPTYAVGNAIPVPHMGQVANAPLYSNGVTYSQPVPTSYQMAWMHLPGSANPAQR